MTLWGLKKAKTKAYFRASLIYSKNDYKRNFYEKHKKNWMNATTRKHTKQMIKGPSKKNTEYLLNCFGIELRELLGVFTGYLL